MDSLLQKVKLKSINYLGTIQVVTPIDYLHANAKFCISHFAQYEKILKNFAHAWSVTQANELVSKKCFGEYLLHASRFYD